MEYRIKWSAFSNINFRGATEWEEWVGEESTEDEVLRSVGRNLDGLPVALPFGLEQALDASGFDWDVETR